MSLYQGDDDYLGSFSDEESAYIAPAEDDDDIVEAIAPEPKPWPPARHAPKISASHSTSTDGDNDLEAKLLDLRRKVC